MNSLGSVSSLSLCHKGHPGYSRCVWEQLQRELLILLSTPTVYSRALPTSSHPEENYTGTGHAKGHPMMETGSCNWLCIPIQCLKRLETVFISQSTFSDTFISKQRLTQKIKGGENNKKIWLDYIRILILVYRIQYNWSMLIKNLPAETSDYQSQLLLVSAMHLI